MDVIDTGDLLRRSIGAAPVLVGGLVVVHHQFFYLHKALDDWNHPKVCLWHLGNSKSQNRLKHGSPPQLIIPFSKPDLQDLYSSEHNFIE